MKSLEHIIREIREGKGVKGDKKNLEHSIRKVVKGEAESSFADRTTKPLDEDVGGLAGSGTGGEPKLHTEDGKKKKDVKEAIGTLGTDKYQGNEFKSIRSSTPHIKPPGPEHGHSQAPENASRQRSIAKEKAGINRVTEDEQLDEFQVKMPAPSVKVAEPVAKAATKAVAKAAVGRAVGVALGPEAMVAQAIAPEIAARYKQQHKSLIPHPETPGVSTTTSFERMKGFKVAPPKPAETRPQVKPEEKTKVAPAVEPKPETEPKVAPATTPKTAPETKTEVTPKAVVLPKIDVAADTKTATATTPKTASDGATPKEATPATKTAEADKTPSIPAIGGADVPHNVDYTASHLTRPKVGPGHAKAHKKHAMREAIEAAVERKKIENMPRKGDRKSIEYVGRNDAEPKTSKEKTSRLATIRNVIDEAKKEIAKKINYEDGKTKVFDYGKDILIINPDQKRIDMDVDGNKIPKDYENK